MTLTLEDNGGMEGEKHPSVKDCRGSNPLEHLNSSTKSVSRVTSAWTLSFAADQHVCPLLGSEGLGLVVPQNGWNMPTPSGTRLKDLHVIPLHLVNAFGSVPHEMLWAAFDFFNVRCYNDLSHAKTEGRGREVRVCPGEVGEVQHKAPQEGGH